MENWIPEPRRIRAFAVRDLMISKILTGDLVPTRIDPEGTLPANARFVRSWFNQEDASLILLFEHESFDPVYDGMIPMVWSLPFANLKETTAWQSPATS